MYSEKKLVRPMKQCMMTVLLLMVILGATPNAFAAPVGTLPVYRFFNTIALGHFFTIDETEKNYVIAHYPQFRYEGVAFYAYPPDANVAGTWYLSYDWGCKGSPGVGQLNFNNDGTFNGSLGYGTWTVVSNQVTISYTGGGTVYTGTIAGTHMGGYMSDSLGDTGCWSADKQ